MRPFTPLTLFSVGILLLIVGGVLGYVAGHDRRAEQPPLPFGPPRSFEECAASGNPVMESYPRRCRAQNGQIFTEIIPPITPPVETDTSSRPAPPKVACAPAGCSSQLCVDADKAAETVSTCEFRAEYACYRTARCEQQANGTCGWTQTTELTTCLQHPPVL